MIDQFTHLFRLQAIISQGSLRKAAEQLNVTQPALTHSIAQLEKHFGEPLLVRHARGVTPTRFGERVLATANRLSRHWELAERELGEFGLGNAGVLRLSAGPLWRTVLLPPIVAALHEEFPNITVEMGMGVFQSPMPDLLEGRVDVIFGGAQTPERTEGRLVRREFTTVQDRVVARESHPLFRELGRDGMLTDPMRVLEYPWIVYTADPVYELETVHGTLERLKRAPKIRIRSESLIAVLAFLQNGDYLCVLPEAAVTSIRTPKLLPVPVSLGHRMIRSGAYYREEMQDWPPLKRLLDLCEERVIDLGLRAGLSQTN